MATLYKVIGFGDSEHGFFNEKSVTSSIHYAYGFYQAHITDINCTGAVIIAQDHECWEIVEEFGTEGMSIECGNFMSFSVSKSPALVMVWELPQGGLQCPPNPAILPSSTKPKHMTVTLTASYKESLTAGTVEKIDELLEENYALDDILEFIDEYNENDFVNYYEEYVRCGEAIGYEAVDALIGEMGCMSDIEDCDERYQGCYHNEAEFAEHYYAEMGEYIPDGIVVDWEATWEQGLRYDFTACNDGDVYRPCHIFRDCWLKLD